METRLIVNGMHCEHCEAKVVKNLSIIEGIKSVVADHNNNLVIIEHDDVDIKNIKKEIKKLGFKVK